MEKFISPFLRNFSCFTYCSKMVVCLNKFCLSFFFLEGGVSFFILVQKGGAFLVSQRGQHNTMGDSFFRTDANKGYAFVNFTQPGAVQRLHCACDNKRWKHCSSSKICQIACAAIQVYIHCLNYSFA